MTSYPRPLRRDWTMVGSENVVTIGAIESWNGEETRGTIYCHGSGQTAFAAYTANDARSLVSNLAYASTVQSADWGLQSWGNDTAVTEIGNGIDRLRNDWGVTGKIALVGASMGGCNALNYAVRFPEDVACVAAVIALTDLGALYDTHPEYVAEIDTAYGGTFDSADRAAHSPIAFANTLDAAMPISLWTSTNDPLVLPAWHTAFVAARPQTEQFDIGAHGHGFGLEDGPVIADWVLANR